MKVYSSNWLMLLSVQCWNSCNSIKLLCKYIPPIEVFPNSNRDFMKAFPFKWFQKMVFFRNATSTKGQWTHYALHLFKCGILLPIQSDISALIDVNPSFSIFIVCLTLSSCISENIILLDWGWDHFRCRLHYSKLLQKCSKTFKITAEPLILMLHIWYHLCSLPHVYLFSWE